MISYGITSGVRYSVVLVLLVFKIGYAYADDGTTCFSCQGVTSINECTTVQWCDVGQVCFVEIDVTNGLYNFGCRGTQVCLPSVFPCRTCCHGNLCNERGCGFTGLRLARGPVCYNCTSADGTRGCTQIAVCPQGQMCSLERVQTEHDTVVRTKCADNQICPQSVSAIGRRAMTLSTGSTEHITCRECCHGDLCNNRECTHSVTTGTMSQTTTLSTASTLSNGWSTWSSWTACPYTCGASGIRHRFRHCNTPTAPDEGTPCQGHPFDSKLCHNGICCSGPPIIKHMDGDKSVKLGASVIMHCIATNFDTLLWEGPKIVGKGFPRNVRVDQETYQLVILGITSENVGMYRCVASNTCGVTSQSAHVNAYT